MGRRVFAVLAMVVVLAACGDSGADQGRSGASGIAGVVLAGPQCALVTAGTPCPDRPAARIVVRVTAADGTVTQTRTDADGRFRLSLPPGSYVAEPVADPAAGVMFAKPQDVRVPEGAYAQIELRADTGIR